MSPNKAEPSAKLGTCIVLKLLSRNGESEPLEFDLVPDNQADYVSGFLGVSTPLAQAILGEKTGVTIPYFTDELMGVEIISIRVSTRTQEKNIASQREAALNEAKEQIEFTNAVLFAASVDTKWGEYDADGLDYDEWKAQQSQKNPPNKSDS